MADLLAGVVVGVVVFQTAILAPTVFKTLEAEPAGRLLRALFPRFFRLLAVLGAATLASLWLSGGGTGLRYLLAGLTVVLSIACAALVPATNRARDADDRAAFRRLHTASVVMTLAILLANLALPLV